MSAKIFSCCISYCCWGPTSHSGRAASLHLGSLSGIRAQHSASINMSRTETLSLQLDTLQLEMQQLQVLNAKLMEDYPEGAALADALAKQNLLQEENLQLKAEASQLRAEYHQLLLNSQEDQRLLRENNNCCKSGRRNWVLDVRVCSRSWQEPGRQSSWKGTEL